MANIDYGKIISRSWEITEKNKWLWVYGLALGATSYAGSNLNFNNFSRSFSSFTNSKTTPTDLQEKSKQVLGLATTALQNWLASVSPLTWLLVILALIAIVVFAIAVGFVLHAWVKAALIGGLKDAESDKPVNLTNSSSVGIKNLKNMVVYNLISSLIAILVLVAFFTVLGIIFFIFNLLPLKTLWLVLWGVIGTLAFFLLLIILGMIGIYAERLIVLKGVSPWEAWKRGLSLGRGNFLHTLVMGIINLGVGCASGCLIFIVSAIVITPLIILMIPTVLLSLGSRSLAPIGAGVIVIALVSILLSLAGALFRAIVTVFTYENWNLFFDQVLEGEK